MRNDKIRERLNVENITERCRKARLRWFGHVKRLDQEYVGRKMVEMGEVREEDEDYVGRHTLGEGGEEDQRRDGWTVSTET